MNRLIQTATLFVSLTFTLAACSSDGTDTSQKPPTPESVYTVTPTNQPPMEPTKTATRAPTPTPTPTIEPALRPPQPLPKIGHGHINRYSFVPASIDQQILDSDVIVVASFVSATAGVQTIPGDSGVAPTYRPTQILRFKANQYLKGIGPYEFTVKVLDRSYAIDIGGVLYSGYLTEADAMTAASTLISQRNATYDNHPAVLFLKGAIPSESSSEATARSFGFVQSNLGAQSNFKYAVDTLSRTWLPAKGAISAEASVEDSAEYITDGSKTPPPTVTLTELKTRIMEIDSKLQDGKGNEDYEKCVYNNLVRERHYRAYPESRVRKIELSIGSGLAAESVSLKKEMGDPFHDASAYHEDYHQFWYSGPDDAYFTAVIHDEDSVASNGYLWIHTISRPLPMGHYSANIHIWSAFDAICMPKPSDGTKDESYSNWTITVTAPAGTLHEAFFDPVEGGEDQVSPAGFSVGGTDTEITGLEWAEGKVVLSLYPIVSPDGYTLDFIELDGSVSLSLRVEDATIDSATGTYSWPVADQPWANGDKLMLRIRED